MIHADHLEYGWWEHKRAKDMPDTLGQKNNYVLTEEELALLDWELEQAARTLEKMRAGVANTLRIRRRGAVLHYNGYLKPAERDPVCYTLAHVMQLMVDMAKFKLGVMQVLHGIAAKRVEMKRAAEVLVRVPKEEEQA